MNAENLVYVGAVLVLSLSLFAMSSALKKLTAVIKEKSAIWILPAAAGAVLAVSLAAYAQAVFAGIPGLEKAMSEMLSDAVLFDKALLESHKAKVSSLREGVLMLKAVSFSCFLLSALLLTAANAAYIRMISK